MKKYIISIILILISVNFAFSLDVPKLTARVNDYAGMLSEQEKQELEQTLKNIETNTSAQLVLLTMPSLEDENLEEYTMRVADEWKIGQDKMDNGVILFIAMKERRIRIEVGYGLEPVLPDGRSGTIIRNILTPAFKQGMFYQGFTDAFLAMNSYITGSDNIDQYEQSYAQEDDTVIEIIMILIIISVFVLIFILGGKKSLRTGRGIHWSGGSSWGSSSGRSGFSSGGGFSGGGGSFGGGGASGGW